LTFEFELEFCKEISPSSLRSSCRNDKKQRSFELFRGQFNHKDTNRTVALILVVVHRNFTTVNRGLIGLGRKIKGFTSICRVAGFPVDGSNLG
jgi:ribosomal protein L15E